MAVKNKFFRVSSLIAIAAISVGFCCVTQVIEDKKADSKYEEVSETNDAKKKSKLKEDKLTDDSMVVDNYGQDVVDEINATEPPPEEVTQASLMGFTPIPPSKEVAGIDYKAYLDYNNFLNYCVVQCGAYANVRKEAKADAQVIGKMPPNGGGIVLEHVTAADGTPWAKVKSGEVEGYIKSELLKFDKEALALISSVGRMHVVSKTNNLNIRATASTDTQVVYQINQGDALEIASINGEWVEVMIDVVNGVTGGDTAFVKAEFVDFAFRLKEATSTEIKVVNNSNGGNSGNSGGIGVNTPANISQARRDLVECALSYVGYNYVSGGNVLSKEKGKGTDCSGFVKIIFGKFGYTIANRRAKDQANEGITISKADLRPGDLVFFDWGNNGSIDHVGIYIGNGKMVHASKPSTGIIVGNLNYVAGNIKKCTRIIND